MNLELKNITHRFGGNNILINCSYKFKSNNIYAITGSNGSGKTTLLNIINGFIKPSKGQVILDDKIDILNKSVDFINKKGVLRLWQQGEVFKNLSVLDNLCVVPTQLGENPLSYIFNFRKIKLEQKNILDRAKYILNEFKLKEQQEKLIKELSHGQQKLVAFGRLLMDDRIKDGNTIVILDEPFSGISTLMIEIISKKIKEIAALNNTIILIEHNTLRTEQVATIKLELTNNSLNEV